MTDRADKKPATAQLALELPVEAGIGREDLIESPANRMAIDLIDHWPDWPSRVIVLAGPVGSGKSHIAAVWAHQTGAATVEAANLADDPMAASRSHLVIENAAAGEIDEEALFHAFNQARGAGHFLLITSRSFPASWNLTLPDLISRLRLAHLVELQEPDDSLLTGLIVKLFADRQLDVSPRTVAYLVTRMERSMAVANRIVAWLDREALARGRKINRALAAEALAEFERRG
ncbi:MAG: hypothetical protein KDJ80_00340 [Nitratireductor sp.]|nr:hypothetical protein [Nitratireductor sp.]